ncbi:MAG TPA: MoaD/ThiS family protein [Gemmatimonadota bacterium]|nr:MoaD/ThiS family protein [Gemmatimonadota bacterium]
MLRDCTAGESRVDLDAVGIDGAFEAIRRSWPLLATHVFTEAGGLRPHVLILHNDRLLQREQGQELQLAPGDRLTIVQAVSGG